MKSLLKICLNMFLFFVFASPNLAQEWGERIFEDIPTRYEIYKKNFTYTDSSFLITDIRADTVYWDINSFNIQNLSVYRAKDANGFLGQQPVIFFVHGGGWTDGYASWYDFMSISLTGDIGWTVINVDYRLTSDSVFIADENCPNRDNCNENLRQKAAFYPDNINDVAAAFEWTVENIAQNGGDTSKIFIMGHSAGGHLISLLATDTTFMRFANKIKGAISLSGAYDIKNLNALLFEEVINLTFRGGFENNDEELDAASPLTYVGINDEIPPMFVVHCQLDIPSLPEQANDFYDALIQNGYNAQEDNLAGYTHKTEISAFSEPGSLPVTTVENYVNSILVDVEQQENQPYEFQLYQNYPNPFNPTTNITYVIPSVIASGAKQSVALSVQLKIYDALGREIATLVNQRQSPGNYSVQFDASKLSSGIYFYTLRAGNFTATKKMVLMK